MVTEERTEHEVTRVTKSGHLEVRRSDIVLEDGVEVSRKYHRHVISPGDDYSKEEPEIRVIAKREHTQEVIEAFEARKAELENN